MCACRIPRLSSAARCLVRGFLPGGGKCVLVTSSESVFTPRRMISTPEAKFFANPAVELIGNSGAPFNLAHADTGPPQAQLVVERGVCAACRGQLVPFDLDVAGYAAGVCAAI